MRITQIFTQTFFLTENHPGNLKFYPRPAQRSRFKSETRPNHAICIIRNEIHQCAPNVHKTFYLHACIQMDPDGFAKK